MTKNEHLLFVCDWEWLNSKEKGVELNTFILTSSYEAVVAKLKNYV